MKLFVGLGNPGKKYEKTRHNVGWMVVEALASKMANGKWQMANGETEKFKNEKQFHAETLKFDDVLLVKPQTFMNSSGKTVKAIADFYKIKLDDIYIIHDDLDIKLGEYKIQKGKGPKVHYGVNSIEAELGEKDFWRVRVGIENRDPENRIHGEIYTLQAFEEGEEAQLKRVLDEIIGQILLINSNL